MARNIAYIFLMATWVVICSCSDDEKPGIPYELKTSCLVEDETESTENSLSDNVLYRVTPQQTKSSVLDDAIEVELPTAVALRSSILKFRTTWHPARFSI